MVRTQGRNTLMVHNSSSKTRLYIFPHDASHHVNNRRGLSRMSKMTKGSRLKVQSSSHPRFLNYDVDCSLTIQWLETCMKEKKLNLQVQLCWATPSRNAISVTWHIFCRNGWISWAAPKYKPHLDAARRQHQHVR